jgi:hypothetical protein
LGHFRDLPTSWHCVRALLPHARERGVGVTIIMDVFSESRRPILLSTCYLLHPTRKHTCVLHRDRKRINFCTKNIHVTIFFQNRSTQVTPRLTSPFCHNVQFVFFLFDLGLYFIFICFYSTYYFRLFLILNYL